MDYFSGISTMHNKYPRPKCGAVIDAPYHVYYLLCGWVDINYRYYLCQKPDSKRDQRTQSLLPSDGQRTWPSLTKVNSTTNRQNTTWWRPVVCPSEHLTHSFLACDVVTSCWAEGDVTVSLHSQSWAVPTSQSCRALLVMASLPPSFSCQSKRQHVPYNVVCDHRRDCLDGSDETFCAFQPCQWDTQFQCLSKQVCCAVRHNISITKLPDPSYSSVLLYSLKEVAGFKFLQALVID